MLRYTYGEGIMYYLQFLNWLGEEALAAKLKYTAPVQIKIIYRIMHLYNECMKGAIIGLKIQI